MNTEEIEGGLAALARTWSGSLFARCAEAVAFTPSLARSLSASPSLDPTHESDSGEREAVEEVQFPDQAEELASATKEPEEASKMGPADEEEDNELEGEAFEEFLKHNFHDVSFVLHDTSSADPPVKIPAHRALLAAASEPIYAMLGKGYSESRQEEVTLRDVSVDGFRMLLRCIYTRRQPHAITVDDLLPLLFVADRFDLFDLILLPSVSPRPAETATPPATPPTGSLSQPIQETMPLVDYASKVIEKNLDLKNCCLVLQMATILQLGPLLSLATRFIEINFDRVRVAQLGNLLTNLQVAMTKGFRRLEAREVLDIVAKDSLVVSEEERVFEALLRWGEFYECGQADGSREQALVQLLMFVRFPLMSPQYLADVVLASPPVTKDAALNSLVRDCYARISASASAPRMISTSSGSRNLRTSGKGSFDASEFRWRPRTPRSLHRWKELSFSGRGGDECGLFYWVNIDLALVVV